MTKPPLDADNPRATRKPASFTVEDEHLRHDIKSEKPKRAPQSFDQGIVFTSDEDDPFLNPEADAALPAVPHTKRGFSFGKLALAAFGTLCSFALGLWINDLITALFTRSDWLGYSALCVLGIFMLALAGVIIREVIGFLRLENVQHIKAKTDAAAFTSTPAEARKLLGQLQALTAKRPETAKGQAMLEAARDDIIDGPQLIHLAERALMEKLDAKALALITSAARRVSVVTAVSPRAMLDLAYVLFEVVKLVRAIADLYGARPGPLGMTKLLRNVFAHLAVTGSIAVGDGLVQQILGHGLAARLSQRLGEGVINGMMTARIGLAAMDLCRPLSFRALKRPGMGQILKVLNPQIKTKNDKDTET